MTFDQYPAMPLDPKMKPITPFSRISKLASTMFFLFTSFLTQSIIYSTYGFLTKILIFTDNDKHSCNAQRTISFQCFLCISKWVYVLKTVSIICLNNRICDLAQVSLRRLRLIVVQSRISPYNLSIQFLN